MSWLFKAVLLSGSLFPVRLSFFRRAFGDVITVFDTFFWLLSITTNFLFDWESIYGNNPNVLSTNQDFWIRWWLSWETLFLIVKKWDDIMKTLCVNSFPLWFELIHEDTLLPVVGENFSKLKQQINNSVFPTAYQKISLTWKMLPRFWKLYGL